MSTAKTVVDRLLEADIRRLIRAGLPRTGARHKIAKTFQRLGWTILDMSDKGLRNAVSVTWRVPGEADMTHHTRAQLMTTLDKALTQGLGKSYNKCSFPSVGPPQGWTSTGNELPLQPVYYKVVIQLHDYSDEYRE